MNERALGFVVLLLYVQHIFGSSSARCLQIGRSSSSYRVDELVDQSARYIRLSNDAFLVVLAYRATQFVIVHSRAVLPDAP